MTDQDRSNDALEIEILRADLESTRSEWFKQQREWAEREQEQARRLAVAEKKAEAFRVKLAQFVKNNDYCTDSAELECIMCSIANYAKTLLNRTDAEWVRESLKEEG